MLGSKVRFLLIVFKANLKASSSAPEGPLSMDSNIPPAGWSGKKATGKKEKVSFWPFCGRFLPSSGIQGKNFKIRFKQLQSEAGTSFFTLFSFCVLELFFSPPPPARLSRSADKEADLQ